MKVEESDKGSKHTDALQQLIDNSKKNGEPFSMQVMKRTIQSIVQERQISGNMLSEFLFFLPWIWIIQHVCLLCPGHQGICYGAFVWRPWNHGQHSHVPHHVSGPEHRSCEQTEAGVMGQGKCAVLSLASISVKVAFWLAEAVVS